MIRVSCVIATYGDEHWFEMAKECARPSARDQGFHSILAHHYPDGTLAQARNETAAKTTADALVFLDADDTLAPGFLAAMRPYLEQPSFVLSSDVDEVQSSAYLPPHLLVPAVRYVREDGFSQEPRIPQKGFWPSLNECVIGTLVSKRLFDSLGGFREWPSLEDYDFWLRCYDAGAELTYVLDAVYVACYSTTGRNSDQSSYSAIWQEHLDRIGEA